MNNIHLTLTAPQAHALRTALARMDLGVTLTGNLRNDLTALTTALAAKQAGEQIQL